MTRACAVHFSLIYDQFNGGSDQVEGNVANLVLIIQACDLGVTYII
jgi:hypothetical protein